MKKLLSVLSVAAVVAAALLFTGCEKHAYSYSTNKFRVAGTQKVLSEKMDIHVGESISIVAAMGNGKGEYLTGDYTASTNDANIVSTATGTSVEGPCIIMKGVSTGSTNVTLHLMHDGFDLHKTITVTVLQ